VALEAGGRVRTASGRCDVQRRAGIGKIALVQAMQKHVAAEAPGRALTPCQWSPYYLTGLRTAVFLVQWPPAVCWSRIEACKLLRCTASSHASHT